VYKKEISLYLHAMSQVRMSSFSTVKADKWLDRMSKSTRAHLIPQMPRDTPTVIEGCSGSDSLLGKRIPEFGHFDS
jgi:hypothetical protein